MVLCASLTACQNGEQAVSEKAESDASNIVQPKQTMQENVNQKSNATSNKAVQIKEAKIINKEMTVWKKATVKYMQLEGGFYGLITENGQKLLPMGLPKAFQQDGAVVNVLGKVKKDVMTFQQWGTPFEITEIKLIKAGKKLEDKRY